MRHLIALLRALTNHTPNQTVEPPGKVIIWVEHTPYVIARCNCNTTHHITAQHVTGNRWRTAVPARRINPGAV